MLFQLAKYAQTKGLPGRPGYEYKIAKAVVVLDNKGDVINVEPGERVFYTCPSLSLGELISGGITRSHFLLDSMGVVTGTIDKYFEKHQAFVKLHCAAVEKVPALLPLTKLIVDSVRCTMLAKALTAEKIKETDNITFRIAGDTDCMPDWTDWQVFWEEYRQTLASLPTGEVMRCFLDGSLSVPVKVIGQKLKLSIVGGLPTGSTMIGFDKDAFSSYGLEQSENAACSEKAAAVFSGALNDLIRNAPRPLANTMLLHWLDELVPEEEDPFGFIMGYEQVKAAVLAAVVAVKRLTEAIRAGKRPELLRNRYHIILISGSAGRAMVRGAYEGSLDNLYLSIEKWFDDLSIIKERGSTLADPPALFALLVRMLPYLPDLAGNELGDMMNKRLSPLMVRLWVSILQKAPLPREAAQFALRYAKSKLVRGKAEESKADKSRNAKKELPKAANPSSGAPNLDRIACSLLKAWYNRSLESGAIKGGKKVEKSLNTAYPEPAYHAGRLLAILNKLQHTALGDVGADVVQRFYSAASVTPGLVIGRLIDGAQPHLNKLRKDVNTKGLSYWYEKQISGIMSRLDDSVLKQLDFTGQTLFALGYYHQLAALNEGGKDTDETKANEEE